MRLLFNEGNEKKQNTHDFFLCSLPFDKIDDIVKTIKTIPHKINYKNELIVEGEIYLAKKQFEKINKQIEKEGGQLYANPRNLAAGTIRQLDSEMVRERNLDAFLYDIARTQDEPETQFEELKWLSEKGFLVEKNFILARNIDEVIKFWKKFDSQKEKLEFMIDGVVVKVNDKKFQRYLAVDSAAVSAFTCSSLDKPSNSFSHSALW